jgi:aminopeptidase YwaD
MRRFAGPIMAACGVVALGWPVGAFCGLAEDLEAHVAFLASDSLEGRLVGTPGIEAAAKYIATEFEAMGLQPAFDTSYVQPFEMDFGFDVEAGPYIERDEFGLDDREFIRVLPISGSGSVAGDCVFPESGLPPEDKDITGAVLFIKEDPDIVEERWTMVGRDGLLEWMRDICGEAGERGAAAVVFVAERTKKAEWTPNAFAVPRSYNPVGIPALEITYWTLGMRLDGPCLDRAPLIKDGKPPAAKAVRCSISVEVAPRKIQVRNVAGLLRGAGRPDEYVVIGAHYDHLGYGDIASTTPWRREIHNGADDNASGDATLIEIARKIAARGRPKRSVVFVAFTAEELGAVGSEYFCKHPPCPIDSTIAMINLDTVGRLEEDKLIVFGARSAEEMSSLLNEVNKTHSLNLIEKEEIFGFSDQNPFYARGIPALHFFTGAYDDYHSPDDDYENLNYKGMAALASYVADFAARLAFSGEKLTPVVDAEKPSQASMSRGRGAYLGIVPDFTYNGTGVGIKGTTSGSPAEAAGLEDGDVILRIDGKPLADLQGLMAVLVGRNPGDVITIEVTRGTKVLTMKATLSVRSPKKSE